MKNTPLVNNSRQLCLYLGWIGLVLAACWMAGERTAAGTELVDRMVAVVNDDIITLYDLDQAIKPYRQQIDELGYDQEQARKMLFKLREEILDQLINEKLTDQEVKRLGISVSEKAVDSGVENIKKSGYYTDEQFRNLLAQEGLTMEGYRKQLRDRMLRMQLVNREVRSKIVVTQEEVEAYYEANSSSYAGIAKYHLKHIIRRAPGSAGSPERAVAMQEMAAIHARIKSGESFEALADQYSDPDISAPGGDLGTFPLGSLSSKIQDAVKGLSAGDVTPVLDTDQGIQIFLVYQIEVTPGRSLEGASEEIGKKLYEEVVDKYFNEWLEKLRSRSLIKISL